MKAKKRKRNERKEKTRTYVNIIEKKEKKQMK